MARPPSPDSISHLERLPAELMNVILGKLVGIENAIYKIPGQNEHPSWVPVFSTAILRTNKNLHRMAKSYLDNENKWIVMDIDDVSLLLPWIWTTVPAIVIDPESGAAVPDGLLHIRVKLYLNFHHASMNIMPRWPQSEPMQQTILLSVNHFHRFLLQLRTVELMYGMHVMPGQEMKANAMSFYAKQGTHGLTMRVHVQPSAAEDLVHPLLEALRQFHGPLNEVCIVGAPNPSAARQIEGCISKKLDTYMVYEFLSHVVKLYTCSHVLVADQNWCLARSLSDQIIGGLGNFHYNATPWTHPPSFRYSSFELLVFQASYLHMIIFDLQCQRRHTFPTWESFRQQQLLVVSERICGLGIATPALKAWVTLIIGLWQIFNVEFLLPSYATPHLTIIHNGMELLKRGLRFLNRFRPQEIDLLLHADRLILELERWQDAKSIFATVEWYRNVFSQSLSREYQPLRWMVPAKMIRQELVRVGVLGGMRKKSEMRADEAKNYIIMEAFRDDGEDGEWYCL